MQITLGLAITYAGFVCYFRISRIKNVSMATYLTVYQLHREPDNWLPLGPVWIAVKFISTL